MITAPPLPHRRRAPRRRRAFAAEAGSLEMVHFACFNVARFANSRKPSSCPALLRKEIAPLRVLRPAPDFANEPVAHQAGEAGARGPGGETNDGSELTGQFALPV